MTYIDPSGLVGDRPLPMIPDIQTKSDEEVLATQLDSIQEELNTYVDDVAAHDPEGRERIAELENARNHAMNQYIDVLSMTESKELSKIIEKRRKEYAKTIRNTQFCWFEIAIGVAIPTYQIMLSEAKATAAFSVSPYAYAAVIAEESGNVKGAVTLGMVFFADGLNRVANDYRGIDVIINLLTPTKTPDGRFYSFSYGW